MREKAHCYRKIWKKPLTIHKIGGIVFSKGIEVRQLLVALLFVMSLLLFRNVFNPFLPSVLQLAFYVFLPWFSAGWICRMNVNGKRLDRFFTGYFSYLYNHRFSYSSQKAIYKRQMNRKQSFNEFKG